MSAPPLRVIGELIEPVSSWTPERDDPDGVFAYIDLSAVDQDAKAVTGARELACSEAPRRARQLVRAGDVLVSTVRPNLNGVALVPVELDGATVSTGFCVLRPRAGQLDSRYLYQWVKSPRFVSDMVRKATGASYPAVSDRIVCESKLPLPALPEQRRIAEILDKADALRAKRRAALARLDTLTQSIFLDMFGDPATNPKGWPSITLNQALTLPLRNGLSPSKSGRVSARVLTLSAITGNRFVDTAWKVGTFNSPPPPDQSVDTRDFLICRGNGNIRLVGRGWFPTRPMPEVTFPDTMIAARVSDQLLQPSFLQFVWSSSAVRQQIESLARTTNGTFKVNQAMLEGVTIMCPPLTLQRRFSDQVRAVDQLRERENEAGAKVDALFIGVQDGAFRRNL